MTNQKRMKSAMDKSAGPVAFVPYCKEECVIFMLSKENKDYSCRHYAIGGKFYTNNQYKLKDENAKGKLYKECPHWITPETMEKGRK